MLELRYIERLYPIGPGVQTSRVVLVLQQRTLDIRVPLFADRAWSEWTDVPIVKTGEEDEHQ